MDSSEEQFWKACLPIICSLDSAPNVTFTNWRQYEKLINDSISMLAGIHMDFNERQAEKAREVMSLKFELDSNVTLLSPPHSKHPVPRVVRVDGKHIDCSERQW
jgi:hypothetical protein